MQGDLRLDSHKLMYHPCEVARWMEGENIYPIEIEISPSGACNHRCTFCAVDYLGYNPAFLESGRILENLESMKKNGLKSVICSGEGEPLLNKDMPFMANRMKAMGLDVAMSSNGVLLNKTVSEQCLDSFVWIRFSVAAIHDEVYQNIHRGKVGDIQKVLSNISYAVEWKKKNKLNTTLGVQCLLIKENMGEILDMVKCFREIGVDYFTIKPYSQHTQSKNHIEVDYSDLLTMEKEIRPFETESYRIYFRANAMKKMREDKRYDMCYGLPFMTHIDAKGNVWPCINFIGKEEFCYGNIYQNTFDEIWNSEQRAKVTKLYEEMDINKICREACRLDEINRYLYDLRHPAGHVNFI